MQRYILDSSAQYDVTASALSGGHTKQTSYVVATGTGNNSAGQGAGLLGKTLLWNRISGSVDPLTIAAVRAGGSDAAVMASINWEEIR